MVRPNSEHADENWFNIVCRSWAEWATSAASSAKSRSHTVIFFTFDFAFRRAGLNRRRSDLVCNLTPTVDKQKARFNSIEKKIPKRVGERTHPCFTPLLIVNDQEMLPSYWTVGVKRLHNVKRLGEQPIFNNIANNPSLFTKSKILVRSMKPIYKGRHVLFFSFLSQLWHTENHVSVGVLRSKSTLRIGIYCFGQFL